MPHRRNNFQFSISSRSSRRNSININPLISSTIPYYQDSLNGQPQLLHLTSFTLYTSFSSKAIAMLVPYIPLVAILAIGMTSATPVLKNEARAAGVPELPEGLFKGSCK